MLDIKNEQKWPLTTNKVSWVRQEAVVKGHFTAASRRWHFETGTLYHSYISSRFVPADIGRAFLLVCTNSQFVTDAFLVISHFFPIRSRLQRWFFYCLSFQITVYRTVAVARERPRLPCVKGKRSAVAVVNASPVDWQSRDRVARRQLSAQADWRIVAEQSIVFALAFGKFATFYCTIPPALRATSLYTREAFGASLTCKINSNFAFCILHFAFVILAFYSISGYNKR